MAMVLRDSAFENMMPEQWADSAVQIITGLATSNIIIEEGMPRLTYLDSPRFSHLSLSNRASVDALHFN